MVNICVTGSRTWTNVPLLEAVLEHFLLDQRADVYLHVGDARGADAIATSFAAQHKRLGEVYHADWNTLGKSAGVRRNVLMLASAEPALLIAFKRGTSSRGTDHCIAEARARKIPVVLLQDG